MPRDELLHRLNRIYAAIDAVFEGDLTRFPPKLFEDEKHFGMYQDFMGGLSDADIENLAQSVIANIASFGNHLRRWAVRNGHDRNRVDETISKSLALQVITDLWDAEKHGPPRDGGHSGKTPKLVGVRRTLSLRVGGEQGSAVGVSFGPSGPKVSGSGSAAVIVKGEVLDYEGTVIGDLYELEVEALKAWEQELTDIGIFA